jgi:hypothetical protein
MKLIKICLFSISHNKQESIYINYLFSGVPHFIISEYFSSNMQILLRHIAMDIRTEPCGKFACQLQPVFQRILQLSVTEDLISSLIVSIV